MSIAEPVQKPGPLHVDSRGRGEDVVLIHGWGMHAAYWQTMVDVLEGDYRVHCIDLPGHGKSEYHNEQSIYNFVARLVQTIDSVSGRAVHLIGWSLGGLLSQQLTLQHPDRIKSLVLIASSPCFVQKHGWPNAMKASVLNGFAESLSRDYVSTLNRFLALQVWGSENQKQALRELKEQLFSRGEPEQQALNIGLSLLRGTDLHRDIAAIDKAVMLIGGERDTLVPQDALAATARRLSQASVHIIKGAGHAPFMSHPAEVAELIKAFLGNE